MTPPSNPELSRELVVANALSLVVEHGPDSLTLSLVTDRVGVEPSQIEEHVDSFDHLVALVAQQARRALTSCMIDAADAVVGFGDPHESALMRCGALADAYLSFALSDPDVFTMAFRSTEEAAGQPDDPSPWTLMNESLDDLVADGQLSAERRADAWIVAWSAIHGLATLFIVNGAKDSPEAHNDMVKVIEGVRRALELPAPSSIRQVELDELRGVGSRVQPGR